MYSRHLTRVRGLSGAADKLIGCCRGTRSFIEMRCISMPKVMELESLFSNTYAGIVSKNQRVVQHISEC